MRVEGCGVCHLFVSSVIVTYSIDSIEYFSSWCWKKDCVLRMTKLLFDSVWSGCYTSDWQGTSKVSTKLCSRSQNETFSFGRESSAFFVSIHKMATYPALHMFDVAMHTCTTPPIIVLLSGCSSPSIAVKLICVWYVHATCLYLAMIT